MKNILLATVTLITLASPAFAQTATTSASTTSAPAVVTVPPSTVKMPVVASTSIFATIPTGEDLSSNLIGLDVYNGANVKIGTIKDIAMNAGRVHAYIIGVGGFLGMGDHYVAVTPASITISYGQSDKKWHATMNTDAAALKAAPEYKYAT